MVALTSVVFGRSRENDAGVDALTSFVLGGMMQVWML